MFSNLESAGKTYDSCCLQGVREKAGSKWGLVPANEPARVPPVVLGKGNVKQEAVWRALW